MTLRKRLKTAARPYKAQFDRSPRWVRWVAVLCVAYLVVPIDLFDVIFPWMAFSDDIFIAGVLLKMLHKYGSLPEEDKKTAKDLLLEITRAFKKAKTTQ
jgi:uncharacterized membrane protein YkvA (DUF1232 family)